MSRHFPSPADRRPAELQAELPGIGLSPRAAERLAKLVARRPGRPGCPL